MKKTLTLIGFVAAIAGSMFFINLYEKARQKASQEKFYKEQSSRALMREFLQDVEAAKVRTADMCNPEYYQVVKAPVGLDAESAVIVMGREVHQHTHQAQYSTKVNGDKVEVWLNTGCCERGPSLSGKVGEKNLPNSKVCRDKKVASELLR